MDERWRFEPPELPLDVEYHITGESLPSMPPPEQPKPIPWLNIILFIATFFTTTFAGALMEIDMSSPLLPQAYKGLPFSLTLLLILLCHEFGHYFMAKKHGVEATLPYFIPAPSIIGTFGAVIKMKSPLYSKRSLLDVGAAGPLAGVAIAIPAILIGLRLSEIRLVAGMKGGIGLGSSLLFELLSRIAVGVVPDNYDIVLHPIAFAGWIGLVVTMLNLLPIGQLDGGHIAYALFGRQWHRLLSYLVLPVLFVLGVKGWEGWLIWCVLSLFVMGTKHPPTLDDHLPLDKNRQLIGGLALVIFILTFTPVPFTFDF